MHARHARAQDILRRKVIKAVRSCFDDTSIEQLDAPMTQEATSERSEVQDEHAGATLREADQTTEKTISS